MNGFEMERGVWFNKLICTLYIVLFFDCVVLYCIGFHFHKTKAERTEEVVIIYDDTQDLGAKNGFHFHKQQLQYLHLHLHGGKSMAFMRFPLIIIWRVLIGGVLRKSLLVDPCLQGLFEILKCLGVFICARITAIWFAYILRAFPSTFLKNLSFTISKANFIIYNTSFYNISSIKTYIFLPSIWIFFLYYFLFLLSFCPVSLFLLNK